jgi:hypothetical protein
MPGWDMVPILLAHEATIDRLLPYSIFGGDKIPISQEELLAHEAIIDQLLQYSIFGRDKIPISQEEFLRP